MLDFTSSLYLGLRHGRDSLVPWAQLTTGVPAALEEHPLAPRVAAGLAALVGLPAATMATSTLHAFWDLAVAIDPRRAAVFVDAGTYATGRWCAERARALGADVRAFAHHDPEALASLIRRSSGRRHAVVLTDGFCPDCGRLAPLAAFAEVAAPRDGLVVIDDTQALGVLGTPAAGHVYGIGGGGSVRAAPAPIRTGRIAIVASLAKGLGVPVAVVASDGPFVRTFERRSETRVHASPPSAAHLHAAAHALEINRRVGDRLRDRLAALVIAVRRALRRLGAVGQRGLFPLQRLRPPAGLSAAELHAALLERDVRTVLHRARGEPDPVVSAVLTAGHSAADVEALVEAFRDIIRSGAGAPIAAGVAP
jgi:8-amino-7-oxononanoate synthase